MGYLVKSTGRLRVAGRGRLGGTTGATPDGRVSHARRAETRVPREMEEASGCAIQFAFSACPIAFWKYIM